MSARVTVFEVGPRDGLQNAPSILPTPSKVKFIEALVAAGCPIVEATSFVNPQRVPQLADAEEVMHSIRRVEGVRYPVLVPNQKGLARAIQSAASEIAIFASTTETFSERNIGASRKDARETFREVCVCALDAGIKVRGYLSMVIADPWEGKTDPQKAADEVMQLLEMGCYEVSLGDTIGVGTPTDVDRLLRAVEAKGAKPTQLAAHFHDTYGQALVNVLTAFEHGITTIDSSAGGLGGCPFAKSATGNLATEDLVVMLDGMGIETGIDVMAVARASKAVCDELGIEPPSCAARALISTNKQ